MPKEKYNFEKISSSKEFFFLKITELARLKLITDKIETYPTTLINARTFTPLCPAPVLDEGELIVRSYADLFYQLRV